MKHFGREQRKPKTCRIVHRNVEFTDLAETFAQILTNLTKWSINANIIKKYFAVLNDTVHIQSGKKGNGAMAKRKNVLLILSDQQRLDTVSAYGMNDICKTPNIDQLAAEGMKFTNAYTSSAICASDSSQ